MLGLQIKLRLKYFKAQGHMLAHADDVIANLSLVRDYQRRPVMAKRMSSLVDDVNYFANAVTAHTVHSKLVVPATSMFMYWLVMAVSPLVMLWSGTSAGVLLAALNAMQTMGKVYGLRSKPLSKGFGSPVARPLTLALCFSLWPAGE